MSRLEALTGKGYLSYSAVDSLLQCGQRFKLERVDRVTPGEAWWFVGGTAVHTATELTDKEGLPAEEAWRLAWSQGLADLDARGVDRSKVRAGGRVSKEWPDKENALWWEANGLALVQGWCEWRNARFNEGWRFVEMADGAEAVEVEFEIDIEGTTVKGYIDRVMLTETGQPIVIDLKTGNHAPASSLQLGVYRAGLKAKYGISPALGAYFMCRRGTITDPVSLLHYNPEFVGRMFTRARAIIENELFIPHVTAMCATCTVAPYCPAVGGVEPAPPTVIEAEAVLHLSQSNVSRIN